MGGWALLCQLTADTFHLHFPWLHHLPVLLLRTALRAGHLRSLLFLMILHSPGEIISLQQHIYFSVTVPRNMPFLLLISLLSLQSTSPIESCVTELFCDHEQNVLFLPSGASKHLSAQSWAVFTEWLSQASRNARPLQCFPRHCAAARRAISLAALSQGLGWTG